MANKKNGVSAEDIKQLANSIARKIPHNYCDEEDLLQEGLIALELAKQTYTPKKKCSYRTYVLHRARFAMYDYLRRVDILPRTMRSRIKKYRHLKSSQLDDKRIARLMKEKKNAFKHVMDASRFEMVELSSFERDEEKNKLQLPHFNGEQFRRIDNADELAQLIKGAHLRHDEYLTIILRYFLTMSYRGIGKVLGVSQSRVSQIHKEALAKLRQTKLTMK